MYSDWSHYRSAKRCPRCNGNLFIERAIDGWVIDCLQCGYERDLKEIHGVTQTVTYKPIVNLTKREKVLV